MGTYWEQGEKSKNSSPPSQKEKNWTAHESILSLSLAAWNFYFQNCLHHFWPGLMAWQHPQKRKKEKIPHPPPPPPQKEKIQTLIRARCRAFHWLHATFVSKTVCHHFSPQLIPLLKNWDTYTLKRKKQGPSWVHAEPSHWLHQFSHSKTVGHQFQPRLIPPL